MVRIRLARHGAKKRPFYHVVVSSSESPRDGRFLEQIGIYDPAQPDEDVRIDLDRVDYWVGVGAQPSGRVRRLINVARRRPEQPVEAKAKADEPAKAEAPMAEEPKAEAEAPAEAKAEEAPAADAEPAAEGEG